MNGPAIIKSYLDSIAGDEKFLLTLGAGIVDSILLMFGFLDQGNYVVLTMGTVGVYIGAKAYEEVKTTQSAERVTIASGEPQ